MDKKNFSVGDSTFSINLEMSKLVEKIMRDSEITFVTEGLVTPVYQEKTDNRNNIIRWGTNNDFPQQMLNIMQTTPEHNAVAKKVAEGVYGDGIDLLNKSQSFKKFIENNNGEDNILTIAEKITWDYVSTGAYAIEVMWGRGGKQITSIKHIPVGDVRKSIDKIGEPCKYKLSNNWQNTNKNPATEIVSFSPTLAKEYPTQILFEKRYVPGCVNYALPLWFPGTQWILLCNHIANFHLYNTINGYKPSIVFSFKKSPSPEIQREISKRLDQMYTGKGAGTAIKLFAEHPDFQPEITVLNANNNDQQYIQIIEIATQKILNTWGVTDRSIIGESTNNGFNTSYDRMLMAEYRFQKNVISPIQDTIQQTLNTLAYHTGINTDAESIVFNKKIDEEKFVMLKELFGPAAKEIQQEQEIQEQQNNNI
jgi:hypothetical protein